jgi:hypothetical protein
MVWWSQNLDVWRLEKRNMVPNFRPGLFLENAPLKPIILNAWFQLWNMEGDLWWFGQQYLGILLVL